MASIVVYGKQAATKQHKKKKIESETDMLAVFMFVGSIIFLFSRGEEA